MQPHELDGLYDVRHKTVECKSQRGSVDFVTNKDGQVTTEASDVPGRVMAQVDGQSSHFLFLVFSQIVYQKWRANDFSKTLVCLEDWKTCIVTVDPCRSIEKER